ncbi:MAG: DUF3810 domain-containing protein [Lachnospiraceae bacterium]|nr:DUF3810 domain-containing protein [Lachnospiraceae bacterium]
MKKATKTAIVVMQLLSWILLACAWWAPGFADWWAAHVFRWWTALAGTVFGVFPFSVAEFGLYLLVIWFVGSFALAVRQMMKGADGQNSESGSKLSSLGTWGMRVLLAASILWFLFVTCSGINYQRTSFTDSAGIEIKEYTLTELKGTCLWLTQKVNEYAVQVERDENGVMQLSLTQHQTGQLAAQAMEALGDTYPLLSGSYPVPKPVTFSKILSLLSLTGVYSPLTIEANYNREMTAYNIPFSMCHELSHLRGFMQEQEANFIAFLACSGSQNADFCYSGYMLAWIQCTNALYDASREDWSEVRSLLLEEAQLDLTENSAFWNTHEGVLSEVSDQVNDTYLKANGQSDGVLSYEKVVDLLVSYWMENYEDD